MKVDKLLLSQKVLFSSQETSNSTSCWTLLEPFLASLCECKIKLLLSLQIMQKEKTTKAPQTLD